MKQSYQVEDMRSLTLTRLRNLAALVLAVADGIQRLFTRFGKWNSKLDIKKVLVKPSPQLEFDFADGDG